MSANDRATVDAVAGTDDVARTGPRWLTPAGLPRSLALALVQLAGLALLVVALSLVVNGNILGLLGVTYGADLVIRPSSRHLPHSGAMTTALLDLVERWPRRVPPAP